MAEPQYSDIPDGATVVPSSVQSAAPPAYSDLPAGATLLPDQSAAPPAYSDLPEGALVVPSTTPGPSQPQPAGTVSRALKGFWDTGPGAILSALDPRFYLGTPNRQPGAFQMGLAVPAQEKAAEENAQRVFADPKSSDTDKFDSIVYMTPMFGPLLKSMDDKAKAGNHAEAYGEAAGLIGSLLSDRILPFAGSKAADLSDAVARKVGVSERVGRMMNQYIGLQPSDLAKFKRTIPEEPLQVGNTVYQEAGFKNNLADQKTAIEQAIDRRLGEQHARIGLTGPAKTIDATHLLLDKALELQDEIARQHGVDEAKLNAVDLNMNKLNGVYGGSHSPTEALVMRREIKPTTFDPAIPNIEQRYRQMVYHGLNDEIENALPPGEAEKFRNTNDIIHRLIMGRDAAGEKLANGNMKYVSPINQTAKGFTPLKTIAKGIPNETVLPREANLVRAPIENNLSRLSGASRLAGGLAGDDDVARFVHAADLVGATEKQSDQK